MRDRRKSFCWVKLQRDDPPGGLRRTRLTNVQTGRAAAWCFPDRRGARWGEADLDGARRLIQDERVHVHIAVGIVLAAHAGAGKRLVVRRPQTHRIKFCAVIRCNRPRLNLQIAASGRGSVPGNDEFIPIRWRFDFRREQNGFAAAVLRTGEV